MPDSIAYMVSCFPGLLIGRMNYRRSPQPCALGQTLIALHEPAPDTEVMRTHDLAIKLQLLPTSEIKALATAPEVAERTLWNIRTGITKSAREDIQDKIIAGLKTLPRRRKSDA